MRTKDEIKAVRDECIIAKHDCPYKSEQLVLEVQIKTLDWLLE